MNLRIIIDKSLFQSLPPKAFTPLDRHFQVIIPPILVKEILGDLSSNRKIKEREVDMKGFVSNLADRFGAHSIVCHDYLFLLTNSLLGYETPMDGRVVAGGLTPVATSDGKLGYKILDTPYDESLGRWKQGTFTVEEAFWAYRWQKIKKFINTKLYIEKLKEVGVEIKPLKSLKELEEVIESILSNPKIQGTLLGLINREFHIPWNLQVKSVNRWFQLKRPLLKNSSPYAAYCLKATLLLAIGNLNESILGRQHEHDLRDLEYCYYLPFCQIFASTDKIHKKLISLLIRPDQSFVGAELSEDLKRLAEDWCSFTKEQKINYHLQYGSKPAPSQNSAVFNLWEKHKPDYDSSKAIIPEPNYEPKQPPNVDESALTFPQFLNKIADNIENAELTNKPVGEGSFLVRNTKVSRKKLEELYPHIDFDKVKDSN